MVHRAVDYILDDEDAFRTFLSDGRIDMHNIAIERCFRHIAMGRRNWLQTESHFSAQNLAFMFGLLESCKLNKVNFGENIEDILTRILCGEEVDALANAIIAILKDEAKREKRQINFVGDKSWKVITEKYIEFYKTII